jgi:hypothetical protein
MTTVLQSGDRIRSLYAGRLGSVVKTYRDGSACILWDDGKPQEEGLGHERMPRRLLIAMQSKSNTTACLGPLAV